MDVGDFVVKPLKDFAKSSIRLVKRCTKPDRKGASWRTRGRERARQIVIGGVLPLSGSPSLLLPNLSAQST